MVREELRATHVQAPTPQVMRVDENGNVVTGEVDSSPVFAQLCDSFRHGAARLSERARVGT